MSTRLLVMGFLATLLAGCATNPASTVSMADPDPRAGTWRPWVLASGQAMRLPAPPSASATSAELDQVRSAVQQRDAAAQDRARYWDAFSPSYRWNEIIVDINSASPFPGGGSQRALTMMNVAINDAMIAAWDSKYAHNRARPGDLDKSLALAVPMPRSPSYPCEHSVAAGAASAVLAHLYPREAQRLNAMAEEAARSRVMAGVAFPSDTVAGLSLGRAVAARVIEHMKTDGTKWAGTVPTGPGLWRGTNPVGVEDTVWKLFVLKSPDQFRPGPPPAHDSPQRATELAEVKGFQRTPFTNAKVSFWQFGQMGQPGVLFRLNDEVTRRFAEERSAVSAPRAARAYALVNVAHYEGWIASQDAKFHYWTARPNQFDATITTVVPTPPFPTYPSNAATLVKAPTVVLTYLFPRERDRYEAWVKEFGESRLWAGIHFRSDITSGWEIGRQVGEAVVARAKADGS